jgi:pimeloyl-ACP methyl ester carboxylesterase
MTKEVIRLPGEPGEYGPPGRSPWMEVDWREHQRWITIGRPINVIELGSGPPLVFIHGLSGSWQNWLEQLPVFAREHRVVAFDLPGFGVSEMPAQEISIAGYARTVDALYDALEIDSAAVVGNSMGGFIGAERLPAPLVAEQMRGSGRPGFIPALDALTGYPIRDRLGEIACPTLILWGAEDKLVPASDADEFERLIPNARKVVWPHTGHVAMLERPTAFNRLLAAFLAEQPGERVGAPEATVSAR